MFVVGCLSEEELVVFADVGGGFALDGVACFPVDDCAVLREGDFVLEALQHCEYQVVQFQLALLAVVDPQQQLLVRPLQPLHQTLYYLPPTRTVNELAEDKLEYCRHRVPRSLQNWHR